MNALALRRLPLALIAGALLAFSAACSSSASEDGASGQMAGATTAMPGPERGDDDEGATDRGCPDETELVIHTGSGDERLVATSAKAAVTLGSSMELGFGNFDVPDQQIGAIAAPTLTGDQLFASLYLSASQGATLEPGTYVSTSSATGPLQLNAESAYDRSGRLFFMGFSPVEADTVEITTLDQDRKLVCGTIATSLLEGSFRAEIISWS